MKKTKKTPVILFFIFCLLLSITTLISFSSNTTTEEVLIKSITPVYDETSGVIVNQSNITFNDKNQVVKYNIVLENTQNYDVKISDIKLSTPTEEFLSYKIEDIKKDDVLSANSTKELTVSFETMRIDGWGRNFEDELTANISFEKALEEVTTPEEDKHPEPPVANVEELTSKAEKIEVTIITDKDIEISSDIKVEDGDKVDSWIYPDTTYIGTHEVEVSEDTTKIIGIVETLKKEEVKPREHNIALVSEDNKTLGYVSIYINEQKEILKETPQDSTDKEEVNTEGNTINKPSTDSDNKVENPYTSDKKLVGTLIITTCITGVAVIIASKNKLTKYTVFILMLSPVFTITNAEEVIEVSVKNNVSFKSQNVMKMAYTLDENNERVYHDYWAYNEQLKNFYIANEIKEISEYKYKFDVTEEQNGRVIAYLVTNSEDSNYYDLYLQAEGIIYPNENASFYFDRMKNLDKIDNLKGFDTSEVVYMQGMFQNVGYYSPNFTMDVSGFDTSKVINMGGMFNKAGYSSTFFELDISNFDTSNVTNMYSLFQMAGYTNPNFTIDVSNFNTSKVTNMSGMFSQIGYNSSKIQLDVSNFDTSKVTNMMVMFQHVGRNNHDFTLDVGSFDTSNVTDMSYMFSGAGYNSPEFNLDVSNFDTSNVINMYKMFAYTGYNSGKLNFSITISNPNITSYGSMLENVAVQGGTKLKVNYTKETEELVDKMIATKTEGSNVVKGNLIVDVDKLTTGDEIHISGEKFNVISQTDDTITMLAQYNIGTDYRQSTTNNYMTFADKEGWEYIPGPKEIDIQTWSTNPKKYINEYVTHLQNETKNQTINGRLITLKELKELGCIASDDYYWQDGFSCNDSYHASWLVNKQRWWTQSAYANNSKFLWIVNDSGYIGGNAFDHTENSIRPTITISKETLRNLSKL